MVNLKTHDGKCEQLDVLDFIARLVVQIPDKRARLHVYYGVYANSSKLRNALHPRAIETEQEEIGGTALQTGFKDKKKTRLRWAQLMERIWKEAPFDVAHGIPCCAQAAADTQ